LSVRAKRRTLVRDSPLGPPSAANSTRGKGFPQAVSCEKGFLHERFSHEGFPREHAGEGVFIHPTALCESSQIGTGTRVWAFAHVLDGAVIGRNCNIGDHAFIEGGARIGDGVIVKNGAMIWEGVTVEDNVFVGPGVVFTNDRYPRSRHLPEAGARYSGRDGWLVPTKVRMGASIGAGAIVLCGVTIGAFAMVAAGAIVTKDVANNALVAGQPARPTGWVCGCGVPIDGIQPCSDCGSRIADCGS